MDSDQYDVIVVFISNIQIDNRCAIFTDSHRVNWFEPLLNRIGISKYKLGTMILSIV